MLWLDRPDPKYQKHRNKPSCRVAAKHQLCKDDPIFNFQMVLYILLCYCFTSDGSQVQVWNRNVVNQLLWVHVCSFPKSITACLLTCAHDGTISVWFTCLRWFNTRDIDLETYSRKENTSWEVTTDFLCCFQWWTITHEIELSCGTSWVFEQKQICMSSGANFCNRLWTWVLGLHPHSSSSFSFRWPS